MWCPERSSHRHQQDGCQTEEPLVFLSTRNVPERKGPVTTLSLYDDGLKEAERHKWIESQKCGRDVGDSAMRDWYCRYWFRYVRCRRLEHVTGIRAWKEFGSEDFGKVGQLMEEGDPLLEKILEMARQGKENFNIVYWALEHGLCTDRVRYFLELIDLNAARLEPVGPPQFAQPVAAWRTAAV